MHKPVIDFHFQRSIIKIPKRKLLRDFIKKIFEKERKSIESLNIIFCSDKYLLKINQKYLSHNDYTDIITFDLSDAQEIIGEIYISLDRIRENAKLLAIDIGQELLRVIFHGILHLCGYQDKLKSEKMKMTLKENYYLRKWNSI
ncbi:MAG: rRNA maturation RNase YbeY [Chitinophagaceae bacterium]